MTIIRQVTAPTLAELVTSEAIRITQLLVHGMVGIVGGILVSFSPAKSSAFKIVEDLPGWPLVYGLSLSAVGLVVISMIVTGRDRHLRKVLSLMATWYLVYFSLFLTNLILWFVKYHRDDRYAPATGPLAFYLGFFIFLVLHIMAIKDSKR